MPKSKPIRASYDAAGYDADNANHWQFAGGDSADAAANPEARRIIRNRARYEINENNSYGKGIVLTLADDTIGTGPRLQLHLDSEPANDATEQQFKWWSSAANLCEKLHIMRKTKTVDGEAVAKIVTHPMMAHDVKLDLQLVDCDRLTSPNGAESSTYVDGVYLDGFGNPVAYDILDEHPGGMVNLRVQAFQTFSRSQIIHYFSADRPEQHRGVSEMASSLNLFAMMRRGTLATVAAFETAANLAMVLETDAPAVAGPDSEDITWERVKLERNTATVLPSEYKLNQIRPEHPSTNYAMFKREILNEVARCINVPYNVAAADSSGYNYASGRLDHQVYDRALKVEQARLQDQVLDRLLGEWLLEASLLGILPAAVATIVFEASQYGTDAIASRLPHSWQWDRRPHVDPSKEAQAQKTRLQSGTTSRELELREQGLDINEVDASAASGFGVDVETYRQALFASTLTNGNGFGQAESEEPAEGQEPAEDEEPAEEQQTDEQ